MNQRRRQGRHQRVTALLAVIATIELAGGAHQLHQLVIGRNILAAAGPEEI